MTLPGDLDMTEDLEAAFLEDNLSDSNFSMSAKVQDTCEQYIAAHRESRQRASNDGDDSDHSADSEARGAGLRRDDSDDSDGSEARGAGPRRGGPTRYRKDHQVNCGGMQAEEQRKTLQPAAQGFDDMTPLQRMVGRVDRIEISAKCRGQTAVMPRDLSNFAPEGNYGLQHRSTIEQVAQAKHRASGNVKPHTGSQMKASRDFLERHAHDGVILKKLIGAMLADSASDGAANGACGESEFLQKSTQEVCATVPGQHARPSDDGS